MANPIFIVKMEKIGIFRACTSDSHNKILVDQTSPIRYELIKTTFTFVLRRECYNKNNAHNSPIPAQTDLSSHIHRRRIICSFWCRHEAEYDTYSVR